MSSMFCPRPTPLGFVPCLVVCQAGSQPPAPCSRQIDADLLGLWQCHDSSAGSECLGFGLADAALPCHAEIRECSLGDLIHRTPWATRPLTFELFGKLRASEERHWRQAGSDRVGIDQLERTAERTLSL